MQQTGMKLIKGKSNRDCFLVAAAMVLGVEPEDLTKKIGHDGGQVVFPNTREPYCFRGFHRQEIIDCAVSYRYSVMSVESKPGHVPFVGDDPPFYLEHNKYRLTAYLNRFVGIIGGVTQGRSAHAVAWDGEFIYDPVGLIYNLEDFEYEIIEFLAFAKIQN